MKTKNILLTLGCALIAFSSCMNGDWDNEINPDFHLYNDSITEHKVISIKELKNQFTSPINNSNFALIRKDIQLKATVITNDKGGNLSQMLVVGDETGNIIVGVTDDDMYSYIPVGEQLLINLKDLYIGGYGANPQLGVPSKNAKGVERMGRMPREMWHKHYKQLGKVNDDEYERITTPAPFTNMKDWMHDANKLVWAEGVFTEADGQAKLADPNIADDGNSVNRTFKMTNGKTVDIRTSCYSDFGAMVMPKGKVRVIGIAQPYNRQSWQIQMRTAADIIEL